MARKYQRKQHLLKQINEMLAMRMTQQEVADELGLTGYRPVHELLKREHSGVPKPKGRPRTRPLTTKEEYEREIAKLQIAFSSYLVLCKKTQLTSISALVEHQA